MYNSLLLIVFFKEKDTSTSIVHCGFCRNSVRSFLILIGTRGLHSDHRIDFGSSVSGRSKSGMFLHNVNPIFNLVQIGLGYKVK